MNILVGLILFAAAVTAPAVFLGISGHIYATSGHNKENNCIKVKRRKIGNSNFQINTIKYITIDGEIPSSHLGNQVVELQSIVELIVNKITTFELEKFYVYQGAVQSQVDKFCDNFLEFGRLLESAEEQAAKRDAIIKICDENLSIIEELRFLNNQLEKHIISNALA